MGSKRQKIIRHAQHQVITRSESRSGVVNDSYFQRNQVIARRGMSKEEQQIRKAYLRILLAL